jgi:transcription antitermination factor NusG
VFWIVAYTSAPLEFAEKLRGAGVETFMPMEKRWTKPRRKKQPIEVSRPAFGPYVFVRMNKDQPRWGAIMKAPGYLYIVSEGRGNILAVAEETIAELRSMDFSKNTDQLPGERARINTGHFSGTEGFIVSHDVRGGTVKLSTDNMVVEIAVSFVTIFTDTSTRTSNG